MDGSSYKNLPPPTLINQAKQSRHETHLSLLVLHLHQVESRDIRDAKLDRCMAKFHNQINVSQQKKKNNVSGLVTDVAAADQEWKINPSQC